MSRQTPVKVIIFDAYGTLFDVYSVTALADALYPGRGAELAALWRQKQLEYSWLRAMSAHYKPFWEITRDALRFARLRLGLNLSLEQEQRLMDQYGRLSAFSENHEVLLTLKRRGFKLGILTNGNREMIDRSVQSAGLEGVFDLILTSDQVDVFKTLPQMYALGPTGFGCEVSEIGFVSSNAWDAVASKWFGYQSFWVNRVGLPMEQLDVEDLPEGRSLADAADFYAQKVVS